MLNEDYKEMLQLLSEEQVDFMIVGAYALGAHGYPRATGDIDIWVKPNDINSRKLYKTLARFGALLDQIKIDDFSIEGIIFQLVTRSEAKALTFSAIWAKGGVLQRSLTEGNSR